MFLVSTPLLSGVVVVKDNLLFAFERCRSLSVDLHKGQLRESEVSSLDLHCLKLSDPLKLNCVFFENGSDKKTNEEIFSGGSEFGIGDLRGEKGSRIKFLIGKGFASYSFPEDHRLCAGIFYFEKDALKKVKK